MPEQPSPQRPEQSPELQFERRMRERFSAETTQCVRTISQISPDAPDRRALAKQAIAAATDALAGALCDAMLECPHTIEGRDLSTMEQKRTYLTDALLAQIMYANLSQMISFPDIERAALWKLASVARRLQYLNAEQGKAMEHQARENAELRTIADDAVARLEQALGKQPPEAK